MKYPTTEGQTYAIVGTADGTITSASGVVIASFTANKQAYFTSPVGGYVTISDENAIVTPVFKLAPGALAGTSDGGDTPGGGGENSDYVGYIEYDDATGAIVDLSIPKYLGGNLSFKNAVFPENYEWKLDMPYLTDGTGMFAGCSNLTSFSGDLPALTNGRDMFGSCTNLTEWNTPLPALTTANSMFWGCTNLTEWNTPLPALTNGSSMFGSCAGLTSWTIDLPNLEIGGGSYAGMFSNCPFTSWNTPLPKLTNGSYMFFGCWKLTSFSVDLPALTDGENMFESCKLDSASVERILSTIPTYTDGSTHQLKLHFSSEAASKFAEITGVTPTTSEQTVSYKGWTITAMMYNV